DCIRQWGPDRPSVSTARVRPDARGEILLHSLEPGLHCTVVVCDALRSGLLTREIVTPDRGETLELDLLVTVTPRQLHGRVLTAGGVPLAGATVVLFSENGLQMQTTADAAGGFTFAGVCDKGPLRIVATHGEDHAARQRGNLLPHGDGEEIVFRLPTGRAVTVRVVDEEGIGVPALPLLKVVEGPEPLYRFIPREQLR